MDFVGFGFPWCFNFVWGWYNIPVSCGVCFRVWVTVVGGFL